jgi:hypothetical protein
MENTKFYRVCNENTLQGLWYDYQGKFTGLIHNDFDFCLHNKLEMEFDESIVGWLSATDSLESLYGWFPENDILELQKKGFFIHTFECCESRFYERFQHIVIKQSESTVIEKIIL